MTTLSAFISDHPVASQTRRPACHHTDVDHRLCRLKPVTAIIRHVLEGVADDAHVAVVKGRSWALDASVHRNTPNHDIAHGVVDELHVAAFMGAEAQRGKLHSVI